MQAPQNMLDHLTDCANVCGEDFPGKIYKRWHEGAHGRSTTQELIIFGDDGETYRVKMDRVPVGEVSELVKDAHET